MTMKPVSQPRRESKDGGKVPTSFRRILVAYDGSVNAKRALDRAIALATSQDAALIILVAANTILPVYGMTAPYYPPEYGDEVIKRGKESLADAVDRAKGAGAKVSGKVVDGPAAETILDVADKDSADLIIIGRRGISGVERFLMGSVSSSVVSHSKCDVLVVK